jgi:DNA invertase Pin-like site-specific DNA recombinase
MMGWMAPLRHRRAKLVFCRSPESISEGRKRARQNGIKFGRKPKLTAYQHQEALERLAQGESQSTIARSFNVDRATISRLAPR